MSIGVDEVGATGGVVVVSEVGFGRWQLEVSLCGASACGIETKRVLALKTARAAIVGEQKRMLWKQ
jgi:hypothetical protein